MEQKIDLYQSSDLELIFEDDSDDSSPLPTPFIFPSAKHLHILPFSHVPPSADMTPDDLLLGTSDDDILGFKPAKDILDSSVYELE